MLLEVTIFAVIGDGGQVDEVRGYDVIVDAIVTDLNFDPAAKWREHLREDDLLVPHGVVLALLHRGSALGDDGEVEMMTAVSEGEFQGGVV